MTNYHPHCGFLHERRDVTDVSKAPRQQKGACPGWAWCDRGAGQRSQRRPCGPSGSKLLACAEGRGQGWLPGPAGAPADNQEDSWDFSHPTTRNWIFPATVNMEENPKHQVRAQPQLAPWYLLPSETSTLGKHLCVQIGHKMYLYFWFTGSIPKTCRHVLLSHNCAVAILPIITLSAQ